MNLSKLYKLQAELDKHIIEKHNIKMNKEELLDNTILALLVEVGELANTTRCFKHWSTKKMMQRGIVIEELADVIHFYLSIGNQAGFRWNKMKKTNYNPLWNEETNSSLTFIFSIIYIEISAISNDTHNNEGNNDFSYQKIGRNISRLMEVLGFTDEEVEQAYLKKHEENYKRQREGY